ncbi:transcription initiation factor TFIID subunit 3-like [Mya arenaria]|uniref:transcription initiation factor TFIID subunit 3-like n=1 Tax=Mya arenaria TaxID=6604 RepID=UPI0022E6A55A|nr:transcription initiation factor TFIID subunit 3-like [Mya arenaria]
MNRSTTFRNKLKEDDPDRYKAYLDKQKLRMKERREKQKKELQKKNPSEAAKLQKQHELLLQRERQQKWLDKKKMEANGSIKTPPRSVKKSVVATRHSIESKRSSNREMKRKERLVQSYQKKMWIRKRDRERKGLKREALKRERESFSHTACKFSH